MSHAEFVGPRQGIQKRDRREHCDPMVPGGRSLQKDAGVPREKDVTPDIHSLLQEGTIRTLPHPGELAGLRPFLPLVRRPMVGALPETAQRSRDLIDLALAEAPALRGHGSLRVVDLGVKDVDSNVSIHPELHQTFKRKDFRSMRWVENRRIEWLIGPELRAIRSVIDEDVRIPGDTKWTNTGPSEEDVSAVAVFKRSSLDAFVEHHRPRVRT